MPRRFNTKNKLHVKKGDTVALTKAITSSKGQPSREKGYQSRVLMVFPDQEKVLVEGVNIRTHHEKPSQENQQGGRVHKEAPIHVSNVMVVDPNNNEPSRIGRKRIEENGKGRWVRYAKKSGEIIDK
ncbi:MAG: 50S ribosomal protein L24 [Rhodobacteraceae bacterium]|nr:50S ribosomal protein L24 [Paracoccaceae bacterium]|tara:strand:- start:8905 stop:9285 length:381 start_codon:yes stop_codon:yes gene_type:complete